MLGPQFFHCAAFFIKKRAFTPSSHVQQRSGLGGGADSLVLEANFSPIDREKVKKKKAASHAFAFATRSWL